MFLGKLFSFIKHILKENNMIACSHPGKIGDALYALPTMRALSKKFNCKVDFYTSKHCRPIKEFIYKEDFMNYIIEKLDKYSKDTIYEVTGNFIISEYKGKFYNNFKNWVCNAGIESLMINWDGEVYRATCRVGESLGNIYNNNFTIPKDAIICTRNWCTCESDIPLTKYRGIDD